jgi:hypothetical protein
MNEFVHKLRKLIFDIPDEYYKEIGVKQSQYQKYFEKMVNALDEKLYAGAIISGIPVGKERESEIESDKALDILRQAHDSGLRELDLMVAYLQYSMADLYEREKYRSCWIRRILNRKQEDFFPHHNAVAELLDKAGMIDSEKYTK